MCCLKKTREEFCLRKQQSWQNPWCELCFRYTLYLVMAAIIFSFVLNDKIIKFIWIWQSWDPLWGLCMTLVWISKLVVSRFEEGAIVSILLLYCTFLCHFCSFNSSLCHLSSFLLSYVAFSRPCWLSEFYSNRASVMCSWISIDSGKLPTYPSLNPTNPTFCPQWEVSVGLGLGEGWVAFPTSLIYWLQWSILWFLLMSGEEARSHLF